MASNPLQFLGKPAPGGEHQVAGVESVWDAIAYMQRHQCSGTPDKPGALDEGTVSGLAEHFPALSNGPDVVQDYENPDHPPAPGAPGLSHTHHQLW
jgi:hypothetical protein